MTHELPKDFFRGRTILITGGTGSIGYELTKQVLQLNPAQLRIFSRDEHKHFWMAQELKSPANVRFLIGDIRDRDRVAKALEGVDVVFHAAALKHVPLCETNPFEAVQTNVVGTQNIVEEALKAGVQKVIGISTDKAAAPINVMGATKLLAEKIVTNAIYHQGKRKTQSSAVRFGNVLGSRGSVIEVFKKQIDHGDQVQVTDFKMVRFVMTIPQAVSLVLKASALMSGSEVFILKMPVLRIKDLAHAVIELYAPKIGKKAASIAVVETGIRPGEKIDELLMTESESSLSLESEDMFILRPTLLHPQVDVPRNYAYAKKMAVGEYSTQASSPINLEDIKTLISHLI